MDISNLPLLNLSTSVAPIHSYYGNQKQILDFIKSMETTKKPIQIEDPHDILKNSFKNPEDLERTQKLLARELEKKIEAQELNQFHNMFRKPFQLNEPLDLSKQANPLFQLQKTIDGHQFSEEFFKVTKDVEVLETKKQSAKKSHDSFKRPFDPIITSDGKVLRVMDNPPPPIATIFGPLASFTPNVNAVNVIKTPNPNYEPTKKVRGPYQKRKMQDRDSPDGLMNGKRRHSMPSRRRNRESEDDSLSAPTSQEEYMKMISKGWNIQMFATNEKEYEMLKPSSTDDQTQHVTSPVAISQPEIFQPTTSQPTTSQSDNPTSLTTNLISQMLAAPTRATSDPSELELFEKLSPTAILQHMENLLKKISREYGIPCSESQSDQSTPYPLSTNFCKTMSIAKKIDPQFISRICSGTNATAASSSPPNIGSLIEEENRQRAEEQSIHAKLHTHFLNWKLEEAKKYLEELHFNTILKRKMAEMQLVNPYYINKEFDRLKELAISGLGPSAEFMLTTLIRSNLIKREMSLKLPAKLFHGEDFRVYLAHRVSPITAKEHWLYTLPSIEQIKELMGEAIDRVQEEEAEDCHKIMLKQFFVSDWYNPVNNETKAQRFKNMLELFPPVLLKMYNNAIVEVRKLIKERKYYWSLDDEIPIIE